MSIADRLSLLTQTKADIKTAIENKGESVGDTPFSGYASLIASIEQGSEGASAGGSVGSGSIRVQFMSHEALFYTQYVEAGDTIDLSGVVPPSYNGLTFDQWTHTQAALTNIQHNLDVGALYVVDSGMFEVDYIVTEDLEDPLCASDLSTTGSYIEVTWGDGQVTRDENGADELYSTNIIEVGSYTMTIASDGLLTIDGLFNSISRSDQLYVKRIRCAGLSSSLSFVTGNLKLLESIMVPANSNFYIDNTSTNLVQSVVVPKGVSTLEYDYIDFTSLRNVAIPDDVTIISYDAFGDCEHLASVIIPGSVTTIRSWAFGGCDSLQSIELLDHTSVPTLANVDALPEDNDFLQIYVPASLLTSFKSATNWSVYADFIVGV